jgi:hypothetical protein
MSAPVQNYSSTSMSVPAPCPSFVHEVSQLLELARVCGAADAENLLLRCVQTLGLSTTNIIA